MRLITNHDPANRHPSSNDTGFIVVIPHFDSSHHIEVSSFFLFNIANMIDQYQSVFSNKSNAEEVCKKLNAALGKNGRPERAIVRSKGPK